MNSSEPLHWYVFKKGEILLLKETDTNTYSIPFGTEAPINVTHSFKMDLSDGSTAIGATSNAETDSNSKYEWMRLRAAYNVLSEKDYANAGKAYQLVFWDINSRFCPRCGAKTEYGTSIMKKCPSCGNEIYPHVSPAILVLIQKGEEVLLVHSRNFPGTFYGLVAGFVETGESLEECVRREVCEETGLTIKNLRYHGNQTWPYPSNLMIGFIADYESGTLKLQEEELSAGQFFHRNNMPEIPTHPSLARKMIDWWLQKN